MLGVTNGPAAEAIRCYRQLLADRERLHGPAHPGTLAVSSNLAGACLAAGQMGDALQLLSGIGPAARLRAVGIAPVTDIGGVGENLQDHPVVMACYAVLAPPPPAGYALVAAVVAPDSRGSVQLALADPQAAPVIDPGFLRDERDVDRLEARLELIRQATAAAVTRVWVSMTTAGDRDRDVKARGRDRGSPTLARTTAVSAG